MKPRQPLALALVALAMISWILPPAALAERVGIPYRGPEELVGAGGSQDTSDDPSVPDEGSEGEGNEGEGNEGEGDEGDSTDPGTPGTDTGQRSTGAVKLDGKIVWQWWWEHSKERYLARASERGRVSAGSAYYWFGSGAKYPPRDIVPVSNSQRSGKVWTKLRDQLARGTPPMRAEAAIALGRLGFVAARGKDIKKNQSNNLIVRVLARAVTGDQNQDVRNSAIVALGMTRHEHAGWFLKSYYKNFRPQEKAWANLAMGLARYPDAIPHLVEHLPKDPRAKDDAGIAAITALGLMGPDAVPAIEKAKGIEKLLKLANPRGYDPLVTQTVRALSLLQVGQKEVLDLATKKASVNIRWVAILSLAHYSADEKKAEKAFAALKGKKCFGSGKNQDKSFSVLAMGRLASDLDPNSKLRANILQFVRREALEKKKNNYTRACAAIAVGIANDRGAIPDVAKLLTDTTAQNHVIAAACVSLGLLKATEHADAIRDQVMLQSKWKADTRGYAVLGLALMGDTTRVAEIQKFSHHRLSQETMRQLPLAIGLLGDKQSIRSLTRFFSRHWKKNQRYQASNAAFGLSWIKDQRSVSQLIRVIDNKRAGTDVRAMAIIALGYCAAQDRVSPLAALYENMSHRDGFAGWAMLTQIALIL